MCVYNSALFRALRSSWYLSPCSSRRADTSVYFYYDLRWIYMFRGLIKYGFLQWPWYTHISNIFYALLKGVGKKTKTPQGTQVPFHTWRGYKFLFHVKLLSIHAPLLLWTACTLVIHHKVGCNCFSMELVITCSRHSSTFFQKLRLNWANMESFWFCPQWWNYWTFSAVRVFIYKFFLAWYRFQFLAD